jgi:hypothetical protein
MTFKLEILRLEDYEAGVRKYWEVTRQRASCVQESEDEFPQFPQIYKKRIPPHFTREDLQEIIKWKHSVDYRRQTSALEGLASFPEDQIIGLTRYIGEDIQLSINRFVSPGRGAGRISGVGIATTSAILTAARPDLYPVIDTYALAAIHHYFRPPWVNRVPRDAKGMFAADWNSYPPYVELCREESAKIRLIHKQPWTPRQIDMALWGLGKQLEDDGLLGTKKIGRRP